MYGFININKPKNITSSDVIYYLRKILKIKKIGHCGTLDPLATGVLPVAIGKATRLIEYLPKNKKYTAEFELGKKSNTYDSLGEVIEICDKKILEKVRKEDIEFYLKTFVGEIMQTPPMFSAIKVGGKKLYELARAGKKIENLEKRKVFVNDIKLLEYDNKLFKGKFEVSCNQGVYIRSIINDLGELLKTNAIMIELTRTKSNGFSTEDSIKLNEINCYKNVENNLKNPLSVLKYRYKKLDIHEYNKVKNGASIKNSEYNQNEKVILVFDEKIIGFSSIIEDKIKVEKVLV